MSFVLFVLQGAAAAADHPPGAWALVQGLGVVLLGWVTYEARAIRATQQKDSTKLTELSTVITGAHGMPGGLVKRVEEIAQRQQALDNADHARKGADEVLHLLAEALRDGQKRGAA